MTGKMGTLAGRGHIGACDRCGGLRMHEQGRGFDDPRSGAIGPQPGFDDPRSGSMGPQPGFDDPRSGAIDVQPGFDDPRSGAIGSQPGFDDPRSGAIAIGPQPQPGFDDPPSTMHAHARSWICLGLGSACWGDRPAATRYQVGYDPRSGAIDPQPGFDDPRSGAIGSCKAARLSAGLPRRVSSPRCAVRHES
jgi:hypothetical protein